jgi:cysteate synthase
VEAGEIPDHYFQAVGSGTGAIAAWEMNLRLLEDGRFPAKKMRLHLAQNAPFTPLVDAWEAGSRTAPAIPAEEARKRSCAMRAPVLGNRNPPYAIGGGVYDALRDTAGSAYRVTNAQAQGAGRIFEKCEGCDIDPAAEVAVAALMQAVELGRIARRDCVALHVTGGGQRRLMREKRTRLVRPHALFTREILEAKDWKELMPGVREKLMNGTPV